MQARLLKRIIQRELSREEIFYDSFKIRTVKSYTYQIFVRGAVDAFRKSVDANAIIMQILEKLIASGNLSSSIKVQVSCPQAAPPTAAAQSVSLHLQAYAAVDVRELFASVARTCNETEIRAAWESELRRKVDVVVDALPWKNATAMRAEGYLHAAHVVRRNGVVPHVSANDDLMRVFHGELDLLFPDTCSCLKKSLLGLRLLDAKTSVLEQMMRCFLSTVDAASTGCKLDDATITHHFGDEDGL